MKATRNRKSVLIVWATVALAVALAGGGCGNKIELPEAEGLFSVNAYYPEDDFIFSAESTEQLAVINNNLFLITRDGDLVKRTLEYEEILRVVGLDDPTALCRDETSQLVFVWEQGAGRLGVYRSSDLTPVTSTVLPEVQQVAGMAASVKGIEVDPGSRTYVYLSDPETGVVHRYVYFDGDGFYPAGILCRSDGDGARFAHVPAGLTTDMESNVLVCDADTLRNWVIRFDPTPQLDDVSADAGDIDPWRGLAIPFGAVTCEPPAAADYTLGDAPECGETDWVGAPSSDLGEFHTPVATGMDGAGRVYVVDQGNDRVQIFAATGGWEMVYGDESLMTAPSGIGVVDWRTGSDAGDINYGAYIFVLMHETGEVRRFISFDQFTYVNQEPPPPPS